MRAQSAHIKRQRCILNQPKTLAPVELAPNHQIISNIKNLPWPLQARQFFGDYLWTRLEDSSYVLAFSPPSSTSDFDDNKLIDIGKHKQKTLLLGYSKGFVILKNVGDNNNMCNVTYISYIDLKGNIPIKVMETQIPSALNSVYQLRETFNRDDEIDLENRNKFAAGETQRRASAVCQAQRAKLSVPSAACQAQRAKRTNFAKRAI